MSDTDTQASSSAHQGPCSCHEPKPGCCKKNCLKPECPAYTAPQLFCKYIDAVVDVAAEFIFQGKDQGPPSDTTPIGTVTTTVGEPPVTIVTNIRQDNFIFGNGALLKHGYIVCAAANIQAPVSVTSFAKLWPNVDPLNLPPQMIDKYVRCSRILVTVHNVNGKGISYVYEADLVGTGGAAGFALLKINFKSPFNLCNPCILPCHPHLERGDSLAEDEGARIYLLGNPVGGPKPDNASRQIVQGILAKRNYAEHSGWSRVEELSVTGVAYRKALGMPIVNAQGQLIGIQTRNIDGDSHNNYGVLDTIEAVNVSHSFQPRGTGWVAGPSMRAIEHMLDAFIEYSSPELCGKCTDPHVQVVSDPAGDFLIYLKAYLGAAYQVLQGVDYDTTTDYTALTVGGLPPYLLRRVRLDDTGAFLNSPGNKEIAGIKVVGLAGLNPTDQSNSLLPAVPNGAVYVPGGANPLPPLLPYTGVSPLASVIQPGDVIVGLVSHEQDRKCQVFFGDELDNQIAPSLVLWSRQITPGDKLPLAIRRGGNALNNASNAYGTGNYQGLECIDVNTLLMPPHMDYPWVDIQHFSGFSPEFLRLTNWQLPTDQLAGPLLPALYPGAPFQPAI